MSEQVLAEVELKFRAPTDFVLPDLLSLRRVAAVDAPVSQQLVAAYYDTADLRLAREGITVRHRTGGTDDGWHLKLPTGGPGARSEVHVDGPAGDVPGRLTELVSVYTRGAPLEPAATLVTDRTLLALRDDSGEQLAEVVDDRVSVRRGDRETSSFREVEVEDKGGGAAVLRDVGELLAAEGAEAGEFTPKLVRALGPAASAAPVPPLPATSISPHAPAELAVEAMLRLHVRALVRNDPRVRLDEEDAVHQMRVSARRLRSALRTYRSLVDPEWAQELSDELGWVAGALGGARDGEVIMARLHADLAQLAPDLVRGDVEQRLADALLGDLTAGRQEALQTLDSERWRALVERLVAGSWIPPVTAAAAESCERALPPLVLSTRAALAKGARRALRPGAAPEDFHRTRILAKRARYAAESVVPVFGVQAERLAAAVARVQETLGSHQDAMVAAAAVARIAAAPRLPGGAGFTLGILHARQLEQAAALRADFARSWPKIKGSKAFRWPVAS